MMDPEVVKSVSAHVYRQFPEMRGTLPKVRTRPAAPGEKGPSAAAPTFLLTYSIRAVAAGGKSMPRSVRVVATANGKILKVSTSH